MNNKNLVLSLITVTAIVVLFVAVYFFRENKDKDKKIKELEEDRIKLILDSIKQNHDISEEVKGQLNKLIVDFGKIDKNVAEELIQALQLFQIGQVENAIEDLVKIIEHLLNTYYSNKNEFKDWLKKENKNKKRADIHDMLTYCYTIDKKITEIEYRFFIAIKTIRNKEDHTINLKLDKYINDSGIITAIGAIIKFTGFAYPDKNDESNKFPVKFN